MSALISSFSQRRAQLLERARHFRFHPTPTEALLWHHIRACQLGVQFRRQQVIGNFIVDFLARQVALVVEIDGDIYHATRPGADAARDRKLVRAGYRVLRLPASVVQQRPIQAVALVQAALLEQGMPSKCPVTVGRCSRADRPCRRRLSLKTGMPRLLMA